MNEKKDLFIFDNRKARRLAKGKVKFSQPHLLKTQNVFISSLNEFQEWITVIVKEGWLHD